jgi:Protein of unknown function (DUF3253)
MTPDRSAIRQRILEKVRQRGLEKTICPSEVARELGGENWRDLMDEVRLVGAELLQRGAIEVTQKGEVVDLATAKGPIRFRIKKD